MSIEFSIKEKRIYIFQASSPTYYKQGRKRPLDTPKRMIERKKGRRRDIEREGEIRER